MGATNRFKGQEIKGFLKYGSPYFGGRIKSALANGVLTLNSDYSGSATNFVYTATVPSLICSMELILGVSDINPSSGPVDSTLWIGGAAALTNGLIMRLAEPNSLQNRDSEAAKSIAQLGTKLGARVQRSCINTDATTTDNHDNVLVNCNFKEIFGSYILLSTGGTVGIRLNDDFSSLATFSGTVFGFKLRF
jgi:hypothetical protein